MNQKPWIGLIHIDIFKYTVAVYLSDEDRIEGLKEFNVSNPIPLDTPYFGAVTCDMADDEILVLSILFSPEGQDTISTWVHEAVHITDIMLDHLGFPGSVDNTEIRAYLTQYVFEEISRILDSHHADQKAARKASRKSSRKKYNKKNQERLAKAA